ncbi:MAG: cupredoxin domain-containing protein [Burkholderiales bacterium]|jgi:plastocyanin|nr:cupredoxin domain-containing protein [Burkholderiales bacterium]MBP6250066.1 cupredoxin domain-containing protein [Leptothrix sp. (in: b-proteobacteria)]MBP7520683.1 cupredoxin domain-containing protein [Leptothrix sp. (in: b-proteobacteria)]HQY09644.1 cupredoxin domain-containing protein [Burkholderiaceae bacterium]
MQHSDDRRGSIRLCAAAVLLLLSAPGMVRAQLAAPGAAASAVGPVVTIEIRDYRFIPDRVTVPVGSTVRWINREKRTAHSVRLLGPQGFESERFFPDESWQQRFDRPGTYPYECGPHPEMKGEIRVE